MRCQALIAGPSCQASRSGGFQSAVSLISCHVSVLASVPCRVGSFGQVWALLCVSAGYGGRLQYIRPASAKKSSIFEVLIKLLFVKNVAGKEDVKHGA